MKKTTDTPKKETEKRDSWSMNPGNRDVAKRTIIPSKNYEDLNGIYGCDPVVKVNTLRNTLFRETKETDRERISLADYAHIIYGWLVCNPRMLSIADYYNYPKDNAPFIYTLDEVLLFDSDEIYNLLQERITTMMLRRQIDREAALAVLREKYGWQRDNEQNINLNTNGAVSFKFGDSNLNAPTEPTNEDKEPTNTDK